MENLGLFVLTTLVYSGVWCYLKRPNGLLGYARRAGLMALLCLPININGNVFTVLGNAVSEKSVFSLCSLYQKAEKDAGTIIGLSGYQSAGQNAVTFIGLSGYQKAGQTALTGIGLSGYQSAGRDAMTGFGLSGYQSAGQNAVTYIGLAVYQKAGQKSRTFGAFTKLSAE